MHAMDSNGSTVPAFITKLWKLVEDHNYDHLIQWNQNGRSFIIHDQSKFAKELLPMYFKHSNMASFIRQLNMYGFRKVSNIENSGLRSERDDIEFFNQFFVKGREYDLEFIKRKISQPMPMSKSGVSGAATGLLKQEDMSDILQDIECMKGKQESVDSLLTNMQRENEALWREVAILRQKHHKQQQIVEKLIQFLVSLVQNRGLMGIKRKAQLMIDDSEESRENIRNKYMKRDTEFSEEYSPGTARSNGPIIHDITDDDLEEPIIGNNSPIVTTNSTLGEMSPNPQVLVPEVNSLATNSSNDQLLIDSTKPIHSLNILDPLQQTIKELGLVANECNESIDVSASNEATDIDHLLRTSLNTPPGSPSILKQNNNCDQKLNKNNIKDLVISNQNNDQMRNQLTPSSFNDHVDGIEAELDWLHDQLSSGINIDTSTLLGVRTDSGLLTDNIWLKQLFAMDDNSQNSYPMSANNANSMRNNEIMGNEIIQFNPNNTNALFDDLDLDEITANDNSRDPLLDEHLLPNLDMKANEATVSFPPETCLDSGKALKSQ